MLDDTAGCASPVKTLSITDALTANTWKHVEVDLGDASGCTAIVSVGLNAASDPGAVTINLDLVTGNEAVREVVLIIANAVNGEPTDLTETADSNNNGLLSDETRNHVVVISYVDQNQRINDIAWTKQWRGSNDNDDLLELNEKAEITIDLTAVYKGSNPLGANTEFAIEVKPPKGSVLNIERTTPANLDEIMNLR